MGLLFIYLFILHGFTSVGIWSGNHLLLTFTEVFILLLILHGWRVESTEDQKTLGNI